MNRPHVTSGGRYPVLRTVGILYVVGAAAVLCYGICWTVWALFPHPGRGLDRLTSPLGAFALTIGVAVGALLMAELIKLLIDVEHNTQVGAGAARGADASAAGATPAIVGGPNRQPAAEVDAESAEAALLRGH